ncbi:MAG: hypothetical protein ACO3QC_12755, partial [Phycisphaerales bacterium]
MPNGDIVVGGDFTSAGGVAAQYIARWDGTRWSALGSGLDGPVRCLAVLPNGDLIVGGTFSTAGGQPSLRLARWNGSAWSRNSGSFLGTALSSVDAIAVLPNGGFAIAGSFGGSSPYRNIARWNGIF